MQETNTVSVNDSILASVKKVIGIDDDNTEFDVDITMHINTVFAGLFDMGVGPYNGYAISGRENTWNEFIEENDPKFNSIKTYVSLRVRKIFDPPQNSILLNALDAEIKEWEWRLYTEKGGY